MSEVIGIVAANQILIGITGTLIAVLAVIAGYGRHHTRNTERPEREDIPPRER